MYKYIYTYIHTYIYIYIEREREREKEREGNGMRFTSYHKVASMLSPTFSEFHILPTYLKSCLAS